MLGDPRAEALAVNFAGQWLNLRGLEAVGPLPMLYPDFDDPLRQAMRREVELLFDSIVREDAAPGQPDLRGARPPRPAILRMTKNASPAPRAAGAAA